jgi:hypothetical protein
MFAKTITIALGLSVVVGIAIAQEYQGKEAPRLSLPASKDAATQVDSEAVGKDAPQNVRDAGKQAETNDDSEPAEKAAPRNLRDAGKQAATNDDSEPAKKGAPRNLREPGKQAASKDDLEPAEKEAPRNLRDAGKQAETKDDLEAVEKAPARRRRYPASEKRAAAGRAVNETPSHSRVDYGAGDKETERSMRLPEMPAKKGYPREAAEHAAYQRGQRAITDMKAGEPGAPLSPLPADALPVQPGYPRAPGMDPAVQTRFPDDVLGDLPSSHREWLRPGQTGTGGGLGLTNVVTGEGRLVQAAEQLARSIGTARTEDEKDKLKYQLNEILEKQFDYRQQRHEHEIAELEAQVQKLRALVHKRQENRREIVARRLDVIVRDAEGLGW